MISNDVRKLLHKNFIPSSPCGFILLEKEWALLRKSFIAGESDALNFHSLFISSSQLSFFLQRFINNDERIRSSIRKLYLNRCMNITTLANLNLPMLKTLDVRSAFELQSIDVRDLPSLEVLHLRYCRNCYDIKVDDLAHLIRLDLESCKKLVTLDLSGLVRLESLELRGSTKFKEVKGRGDLVSLKYLDMRCCTSLESLSVEDLFSLEVLDVRSCENLTVLGVSRSTSLRSLLLWNCHRLREVTGLFSLSKLKFLDINECYSLKTIDKSFLQNFYPELLVAK
jgi:hypothetical protein